jgi:hypothetical protein
MAGSGLIDEASRLTLVDDGSRDKTWKVIEALTSATHRWKG